MARPLALNVHDAMTEAHPHAHHRHHPREPHPAKPGLLKLLLEARAPAEWYAGILSLAALGGWPRGDGHPVLVFPGLAANDWSTLLLRQALSQLGYTPYGWAQGFNAGPRHGVMAGCLERLDEIAEHHNEPLTLIGWSLGGIYARELAKLRTPQVRQVITLGSPFRGSPEKTRAYLLFRLLSGHRVHQQLKFRIAEAPPVPVSSIYSRSDGIVPWPLSLEPKAKLRENIAVPASHFGIGANPLALWAIADRLAQPRGSWKPFAPKGWLRAWYRPH